MKKPFEVGERVRVYGHVARMGDTSRPFVGEVVAPNESDALAKVGFLLVEDLKYRQGYWCHPKQCRRLVKKKRREWRLHFDANTNIQMYAGEPTRSEVVFVREVR